MVRAAGVRTRESPWNEMHGRRRRPLFEGKMKGSLMRVFGISDLHLSLARPKPMEKFGPAWRDHPGPLARYWREQVSPSDLVLIPADISWALKLEEAMPDLRFIADLPGELRYGQTCLRCGYCMPCTVDINIPQVLKAARMKRSYDERLDHAGSVENPASV